jgi:hypothetical protein
MTTLEVVLIVVLVVVVVLSIAGQAAAYNNGVTDGFGYSQEPTCPGYRRAGEYLERTHRYRWPTALSRLKMRWLGLTPFDPTEPEPPKAGMVEIQEHNGGFVVRLNGPLVGGWFCGFSPCTRNNAAIVNVVRAASVFPTREEAQKVVDDLLTNPKYHDDPEPTTEPHTTG